MSETSRRAFLRGGLRAALGTGGLLLPWQGGGALALPDLAKAALVPVTAGPFPVSAETIELRRILARQYEVHLMQFDGEPYGRRRTPSDHRDRLWRECAEEYKKVASVVLDRPVASWGQAVEIAEICWRVHPKVWFGEEPGRTFGSLTLQGYQKHSTADFYSRPMPCLIEAVLQLGGGERHAPNFAPDEDILRRQLSRDELSDLCALGKRPGGAPD